MATIVNHQSAIGNVAIHPLPRGAFHKGLNGKPQAYRKGAAEPYPKDFLCKTTARWY
jgi:hypothetical protein